MPAETKPMPLEAFARFEGAPGAQPLFLCEPPERAAALRARSE